MVKTCKSCQEEKDIGEFPSHKNGHLGTHAHCNQCYKKLRAVWRKNSYKKNREKILLQNEASRKKNYKKHKLRAKKYYRANKRKIIQRQNNYVKQREKQNKEFLILRRIRARLYKAVIGQLKESTTKELLGCSTSQLIQHLEKQFQVGMSWDNYGQWHIDHIIPCASFNLTLQDEQKKCFHYTNLQPLWAEDNITKSDNLS